MAYITCPCGFRADTNDDDFDTLSDCMKAFKAHGCEHHTAEVAQPERWHQSMAGIVALLVFGAIVTSPCWAFLIFTAVAR